MQKIFITLTLLFTSQLVMANSSLSFERDVLVQQTDQQAMKLPKLTKVGDGTLRRFGFKIYDSQLWMASPKNTYQQFATQQPYALQIKYNWDVASQKIIQTSIQELQKQNVSTDKVEQFAKTLQKVIPSVQTNDVITGVHINNTTYFYLNQKLYSKVTKDGFAQVFFGIWLKPNTSEPKLRKKLLGTYTNE